MQVVFAVVAPGQVVANLVAGAVAEAGAQQAGDMMQDFKTAHLLGVCPRAQFGAPPGISPSPSFQAQCAPGWRETG